MSWPRKLPFVTLLIVAAMVAVPAFLANETQQSGQPAIALYESAREDARNFLVRNPQLEVDSTGALILDADWLGEMRKAAAESEANAGTKVELRPWMLARSQARLDAFIADAYALRKRSDQSWQYGVLDARTPTRNYFVHAFVQNNEIGIALSVAVMLLVGIALELTWGSLILAAFAIAIVPLTAQAYRLLDASGGVPWSGGAGLAGAFLGAYFIRGLGGHFTIPGWLLLPAWLAIESFVVRGFWLDNLGSVPWATFCASVGVGALSAGALRLTSLESRIEARDTKRGPNPIVSRAARLRSDGDPYQAFDLIQAAWRDDSQSEEIAETFFSIAVEVGQPEVAAEAIVPSIERALRMGETERAIEYWFPLATKECAVDLDPTAAIKLGEALLDAGHPDEAVFTLRSALEVGVSAIHAVRIVKVARDLDDVLARRAASFALGDPSLDSRLRAELVPIAASLSDSSRLEEPEPNPAPMESRSQLDRRVQAEHQAVDTTSFPIEGDSELDTARPDAATHSGSNEDRLTEQALDTGALSMEALSFEHSSSVRDLAETVVVADPATGGGEESLPHSRDVPSHWNDPNAATKTAVFGRATVGDDDFAEQALLDADSLECHERGFDFGTSADDCDFFDPLDSEMDTDLTPLVDPGLDGTEESTSPLMDDDGTTVMMTSSDERTTAVFDQPTMFFDQPSATAASESSSPVDAGLRRLKALEAVPVTMGDAWIEIDASPRGKSKLPFSRIQTLSMAAVDGLGTRTVLVVDCVLSGSDDAGEPMKSIRFRSDRFDPLAFVPEEASPLAALTVWVKRLQAGSNANCVPSREILEGRFARFDSIEAYERQCLSATGLDVG